MKLSGKHIVGNLHDTFDEAGDGNGAKKSYRAIARPYLRRGLIKRLVRSTHKLYKNTARSKNLAGEYI
jgi:hypothetical protein